MWLWSHARYFEVDDESPVDPGTRSPYKVEIVGVTCDPGLAVARGIWRQACCCRACTVLQAYPGRVRLYLFQVLHPSLCSLIMLNGSEAGLVMQAGAHTARRADPLTAAVAQAVQRALRGAGAPCRQRNAVPYRSIDFTAVYRRSQLCMLAKAPARLCMMMINPLAIGLCGCWRTGGTWPVSESLTHVSLYLRFRPDDIHQKRAAPRPQGHRAPLAGHPWRDAGDDGIQRTQGLTTHTLVGDRQMRWGSSCRRCTMLHSVHSQAQQFLKTSCYR